MEAQIAPCESAVFREKDIPWHAWRHSAVSCAKMAESIEIPFGLWTRVSPRKHVLGGMQTVATWRILLNRRYAAAMRPVAKLRWPLVVIIIIIIIIIIITICWVSWYALCRAFKSLAIHQFWLIDRELVDLKRLDLFLDSSGVQD